MQKLFNNILVPVTIDSGSERTIEEAIRFANQFHCNLHLVGILRYSTIPFLADRGFPFAGEAQKLAKCKEKLSSFQAKYCKQLVDGLVLSVYCGTGDAEEVIAGYASTHRVDLVFVAKENARFLKIRKAVNANRLAGKTNCPVLSMRSNLGIDGLKIIVMPVGNSLPINKIRMAAYLAKHYHSCIHLVTKEKNSLMYEELAYMQKALQVLKDNTDLPVKCKTVSGESIANIALQYAHEVNAGMIIINSGTESFLPGKINRFFSRFVSSESKIPVMTVA